MIIVGAGMSGLLAGQYFRSQKPRILERQETLPHNHKALLRFRSEAVSNLSGIDFKKVRVDKAVSVNGCLYSKANIKMQNNYSRKVTGGVGQRSLSNLESVDRFIAPDDFISQLSNGLDVEYGVDAKSAILTAISEGESVISTMPISSLAKILDYKDEFRLKARKVRVMKATIEDIDCDVYQTIYFPELDTTLYRMSITGDQVIAEFVDNNNGLSSMAHDCDSAMRELFGIVSELEWDSHVQEFGKLIPHIGNEVKRFMSWATQTYGIYSLGRWGTHRQILMDDVVNDLHVINRMIKTENYER